MKTVLFVCIENAGRSQMAAAFFNHLATGKATAISAGTRPARTVNPTVVQAMREVGIDISGNRPKMLTQEMVRQADQVITMGCGTDPECPVTFVPAEDWGLEDPKGQPIEKVREIRDEIRRRVAVLVRQLGV